MYAYDGSPRGTAIRTSLARQRTLTAPVPSGHRATYEPLQAFVYAYDGSPRGTAIRPRKVFHVRSARDSPLGAHPRVILYDVWHACPVGEDTTFASHVAEHPTKKLTSIKHAATPMWSMTRLEHRSEPQPCRLISPSCVQGVE